MTSISLQLLDGQPVDTSQYSLSAAELPGAVLGAVHRAPLPAFETWSQAVTPDALLGQMGLADYLLPSGRLRLSAHETWQRLFKAAPFQLTCSPLLRAMGWYGARTGEQGSARITQLLAGRAIVEHFLGSMQGTWQPMGRLLRRKWLYHYSHSSLRQLIGEMIAARYTQSSPATLEMLGYLLLRGSLPELLVEGVPEHLCYGRSLQSVALIHSVALLEALNPGLTPAVAFDELVRVSAVLAQSSNPRVCALWARTQVMGAVHYGLAHELIAAPDDDIRQVGAAQVSVAVQRLQAEQTAHAAELQALLSPRPADRRSLAQAMLRASNVPHWLWSQGVRVDHWPVLQEHGLSIAANYSLDRLLAVGRPQATVEELVMMGEAWMTGQPPVPQAYASAFETFARGLVAATARLISRLLLEMLAEDRQLLLHGTLELSRVSFAGQEGHQGLFIRCQPGDHRHDFELHGDVAHEVCFELFPAAGVIRRVIQRFDYHVETDHGLRGGIVGSVIREQENTERLRKSRNTPLSPMDSDAYLLGSVSRSTTSLHTPRSGELLPAVELFYRAQASEPLAINALADAAAQHLLARFLADSREAHRHETLWEQTWARERQWAETAARWIIPFYGCARDLDAGDRSTTIIAGCVVDGAFALIPLGLFASSTARIMLHAGEMSVSFLARLTGAATARLIAGLAEQSTVFMARDIGRLAVKLGRTAWSGLLAELPTLEHLLSAAESQMQHGGPLARVDGQARVPVINAGSTGSPDYRLFDPASQKAWGKPLNAVSQTGAMEFSSRSLAEPIKPGAYPAIQPVKTLDNGRFQIAIADACQVQIIERQAAGFDVLIDREVYHLDLHEPRPALRRLALEQSGTELLQMQQRLCRVRRGLEPVACDQGIRLATTLPERFVGAGQGELLPGDYYSHAFAARSFDLASTVAEPESGIAPLEVFVHENKLCKWQALEQAGSSAAAQSHASTVVEVGEIEQLIHGLPERADYRQQVSAELLDEPWFGLPESAPGTDAQQFSQQAPVIRVGSIAHGIDDSRTLRGLRVELAGQEWIYVEVDRSVFYRAQAPSTGASALQFDRVLPGDPGLREYLALAEPYRVVQKAPGIWQDRQNIAGMLFEMLDDSERAQLPEPEMTFERYGQWCAERGHANQFLEYAQNILTGKSFQDAWIELAMSTVPDFKPITARSPEQIQAIVGILNELLPANPVRKGWVGLDADNILTKRVHEKIRKQLNGANLAFASVEISGRKSHVYFAVSGGLTGKNVRLKLERSWSADANINGVLYCDARPRTPDLISPEDFRIEHDPRFTTLPMLRHADRVDVRWENRSLDSERLIGTMMKDELERDADSVTRIDFFTLLDACRSCGGFVLPRLKRDFPQAQFSVTYLAPYKRD